MAVATGTGLGTVILRGGDLLGSDATQPQLTPTGVVAGSYPLAEVYVDQKGRVLYATSVDVVPIQCATTSYCGVTYNGPNIDLDVNSILSIPLATQSSKGVVQIGSGFTITGCVLSVSQPIATTNSVGTVIVPTSGNINIDGSGNISIPFATDVVLGPVQIGNGITVASGDIGIDDSVLVLTSSGILGVTSIGSNINIAAGILSINQASTSQVGVVQPDGVTTFVNGSGLLTASLPPTIPDATTINTGLMQIGSYLNDDGGSGVVGVDLASQDASFGVVRSANTDHIVISHGLVSFGPNVVHSTTQGYTFTKAQVTVLETLVYGGTVTPDFSLSTVFSLTLTGNTTINTPINMVDGGMYTLIIKQDGVGAHIASFTSDWVFFGGTPTISPTANSIDVINTVVATKLYSQIEQDFQ